MDTITLLIMHFGSRPYVPLEEAAAFWGHSEKTMKEKIDAGDIRLPYFTGDDSQKARKLVSVEKIAAILDQRSRDADREFAQLWR